MTPIPAATLHDLQNAIPLERISTTRADRDQHARDQSDLPANPPDVVIWPQTTAEVSAVLQIANRDRIPVTPWGAGTSLEGNPIPIRGGILLDFQQMNQIIAIHARDFQVTAQPGLLYKDMNRTLAQHGLFFAPDPGANASLGGMIANNAAGIRTVKYGATRDNVLALEVVLASGEIIRTGSRSVKQSAGYDLTHLLVGSEGTLGIVTEATLKLAPIPEHFSAATAAFPTLELAAEAVYNLMGAGLEPAALELLDTAAMRILNTEATLNLLEAPNLFMEFTGASSASLRETLAIVQQICNQYECQRYQAGIGRDVRAQLWEARHRLFEIHLRYYPGQNYLLTDIAVPISQFTTMVNAITTQMADLQLEGSIISHAGDGNIHTAVFFPPDDPNADAHAKQFNRQVVEQAIALQGTSTGEHGVGIGKQQYMLSEHGQGALNLMRQIKATLDPNGILNPGKVLGEI